MLVIFNIIVLIFEILYYSLFMKIARDDGKINKFILMFLFITIIGLFIPTNTLISYFVLIMMIMYGMKYIVKIKISLFDMLIILIMLFLKMFVELPFILLFYKMLGINQFIVTMLFDVTKIGIILLLENKMKKYFLKMKKLWDNNNFYIRYIFSCSAFIYTIITTMLLIKLIWEV